jgi:hypothetical protein
MPPATPRDQVLVEGPECGVRKRAGPTQRCRCRLAITSKTASTSCAVSMTQRRTSPVLHRDAWRIEGRYVTTAAFGAALTCRKMLSFDLMESDLNPAKPCRRLRRIEAGHFHAWR